MGLVTLTRAGFKRVGVLLYTLQQSINGKQDKLPTNGTSGQFLANDFTWKTPASSTSGDVTLIGTGTGLHVGSFLTGTYFDTAGLQPASASQSSNYAISKTQPIVFSQAVRIAQIGFNATAGSGTGVVAHISIYSAHPTHGFPYQRVASSTNIAVTATGVKMATLDFTFEKNKAYWIRIGSNNTSLSFTNHKPNYCFGSAPVFGFLGPDGSPATLITGPNNSGQDYPNPAYFIYTGGNGSAEQQPNPQSNFTNSDPIPKILFKVY